MRQKKLFLFYYKDLMIFLWPKLTQLNFKSYNWSWWLDKKPIIFWASFNKNYFEFSTMFNFFCACLMYLVLFAQWNLIRAFLPNCYWWLLNYAEHFECKRNKKVLKVFCTDKMSYICNIQVLPVPICPKSLNTKEFYSADCALKLLLFLCNILKKLNV